VLPVLSDPKLLDCDISGCKHNLNRRRAGCMRVIDRRFMLSYLIQSIRVTVSLVTVNVVSCVVEGS